MCTHGPLLHFVLFAAREADSLKTAPVALNVESENKPPSVEENGDGGLLAHPIPSSGKPPLIRPSLGHQHASIPPPFRMPPPGMPPPGKQFKSFSKGIICSVSHRFQVILPQYLDII